MKQEISFPFPIYIGREKKWYVASCPILDLATQGKTEKEAKENIKELIEEYLSDPDTLKPDLKRFTFPSLTYIPVKLPKNIYYDKTPFFTATKSN